MQRIEIVTPQDGGGSAVSAEAEAEEARLALRFRLPDPDYALAEVERRYGDLAEAIDRSGGLAMTFRDWRMTLKRDDREPGLHLTVEARQGAPDLRRRSAEMAGLLASC